MSVASWRTWNPAMYQGGRASRRYFEGWYYKQVDAAGHNILAVIPGVSFSEDGTAKHAFVQTVPRGGAAHYFAYPIEDFSFDARPPFGIRIGESTFSSAGLQLRLSDDTMRVHGDISFGAWSPWPVTALTPGIMGWYRFVPGMETYHGVLSMDHVVSGSVDLDGDTMVFDGGRGYVEKDWGRSFPSSWIWAQSNNFERAGISVTASVAKVPWMTGAFVGNIAGLLLDGDLHRFATYTGARLVCLETDEQAARIVLRDKHEELELALTGCETLLLKAPELGSMEGRDAESLGGTIEVTLREVRGGRAPVRFHGVGGQSGIEIMDGTRELGGVPCGGSLRA